MRLAYMMGTPEAGPMSLCWTGDPPDRVLRTLAEIGYEGVELQVRDPDAVDRTALSRAAREAGIAICAVSTGPVAGAEHLYLMAAEPEARERAVRRFERMLQLAAEFGVDVSIGRARGHARSAPDRETGLGWFRAALERLLPIAERLGIRIVLEPQHRYQVDTLHTVAETIAFIRSIGSPALVFEGDLHHLALEEPSMLAAIVRGQLSGLMTHFQIADSNRLAPGWGSFNWVDIIETLRASGYDGWLAMEFTQRPDSETCARHAHRFLRGILDGPPLGDATSGTVHDSARRGAALAGSR